MTITKSMKRYCSYVLSFTQGYHEYQGLLESFVQAGNIERKQSLTQAREFMDRFYHNSQTETYTFHVSTLLNSISDKITAKKRYCLLKIEVFNKETTFAHYNSFLRLAMFAPWRSQNPLRKHRYPITGNSFILRSQHAAFWLNKCSHINTKPDKRPWDI